MFGILGKPDKKSEPDPVKTLLDERWKIVFSRLTELENECASLRATTYKLSGAIGLQKAGIGKGDKTYREAQKAINDIFLERHRDVLDAHGFKNAEVVMDLEAGADYGALPSDRPLDGEGDTDIRPKNCRGVCKCANEQVEHPKGDNPTIGKDNPDIRKPKQRGGKEE